MMNPSRAVRHLVALFALAMPAAVNAEDYHVYFLAGQSNMVGHGYNEELNGELGEAVPNAFIFAGHVRADGQEPTGLGEWRPLTPGYGLRMTVGKNGPNLSDRFGPEIGLAHLLRVRRPYENIAIIKHARGGSGLDMSRDRYGNWDPHDHRGPNLYDQALATIDAALSVEDIDGDGEPDRLIPAGIVWMQGESDSGTAESAWAYRENLAEIITLFRAALRNNDLPAAIGRISDRKLKEGTGRTWTHGDIVRAAQEDVARNDPMIEVITSTDDYDYYDPYHYDTAGYLHLGEQFGEALHLLRLKDAPPAEAHPSNEQRATRNAEQR